jgi:hypothetical protein
MDKGASLRDRAARQSPSRSVSALRASIASAWRKFLAWSFPFLAALLGGGLILVAADREGAGKLVAFVIGMLLVLGAMDAKADKARSKEMSIWASRLADMISSEGTTTFVVKHEFQSIRPELDELIAREVAQAMSAGTAETQSGSGRKPASAVAESDAP